MALRPSIYCLSALLLTISGCGGDGWERRPIFGHVTLDGKEVSGSVLLTPQEGTSGPAATVPVDQGSYQCSTEDGPVSGKYLATFIPEQTRDSKNSIQDTPPVVEITVPSSDLLEIDIPFTSLSKRNNTPR